MATGEAAKGASAGPWAVGRSFAKRSGRRLAGRSEELVIVTATIAFAALAMYFEASQFYHRALDRSAFWEMDELVMGLVVWGIGAIVLLCRRTRQLTREIKLRERTEHEASTLANHDPLTGLLNRRALGERLDALIAARPRSAGFALLIIDLDRFKAVNDLYGHPAGDQLLIEVARRLVPILPEDGHAFRLGGDEFALTLPLAGDDRDEARRVARRIIQAMADPFEENGRTHHIGASVGISLFPHDGDDRQVLMRRADIALYRAKEGGRNRHRSFEPAMDAEIRRRAAMEAELRQGLQRDEFRPFYQPLVDLRTGRTIGFELLARWIRSDGAEVGPAEFIPVAEESGLINQLMLRLLELACEDSREWDPALTISINISPVQLSDPWLSHRVLATLSRCGFAPQRLGVEITENALIVDGGNAKRTIEAFKARGIKISLDDFGTGYSSLQHLRMLPFDKIKIDRSFVQTIDRDPEALKIVRAILSLAVSLELPVIAEGIESAGVAAQLRDLGCTEGQGFHLGSPVSGAQMSRDLEHCDRWRAERRVGAPHTASRARLKVVG